MLLLIFVKRNNGTMHVMCGASMEWADSQGRFSTGNFASNSHLLTNPSSWYFLGIQVIGVIITAVYAYVLTTAILKSAMHFTTITTTKEEQEEGLDFFFGNKTQLKQNQIEKRKIHATKQNENSCKN